MRRAVIVPIVGILLAGLTSTVAATNAGTNACSSAAPCLSGINSAPVGSSGAGVKGMAINSYGLRGISTNSTAVLGQSSSGSLLYPGVEGEATGNAFYSVGGGFGLTGMSGTAPAYGVYSLGTFAGSYGQTTSTGSTAGYGLIGVDPVSSTSGNDFNGGVIGATTYGSALVGYVGQAAGIGATATANGFGLFVSNANKGGLAAYLSGDDGNEALNVVDNGYLLDDRKGNFAVDYNGNETLAGGLSTSDIDSGSTSSTGTQYVKINDTYDSLLNGAYEPSGGGSYGFNFDTNGNETITGVLTAGAVVTDGGTYARTRGANGSNVIAYGARTTSPTIEDVGESQLSAGSTFVHLDGDLTNIIDRRLAYHVFITPEGEANPLYVTKFSTGFEVREARGGRSNIAFDYRIVAKPMDTDGRRLVAAPIEKPLVPSAKAFDRFAPPFANPAQIANRHRSMFHTLAPGAQSIDPLERLKARFGPAKFAAMLAEFERQHRQY